MFDKSVYDQRYFKWHLENCRHYSILTMRNFLSLFGRDIHSVVDFGCGIGAYLEAALEYGISPSKIKGYDISETAREFTEENIRSLIEYVDCTKPMELDKYDCVLSFETAEHIDPAGTDQFIRNLATAVSDDGIILFSAAPPGQGGSGHINCQPREYWIEKFKVYGLKVEEDITSVVRKRWAELGAPDYICRNLIIFQ